MMIQRIIAALGRNGKASDWRISETVKRGAEWYLVGSTLDTSRSVETVSYSVAVYADAGEGDSKTRGAYSLTVHPSADDAELDAALARALSAARGMKNPWYPIPGPGDAAKAVPLPANAFSRASIEDSMGGLRNALYRHDGEHGARINSLELFLSRRDERIVNSRGLDVSWSHYVAYTEFIVNARSEGKEEVELFGDLEFSAPDADRLAKAVKDRMDQARDRLVAVPTPSCDGLPVLFKGDLACQIYGYWFNAAQAQAAYEKTAAFALGEDTGTPGGTGDAIGLAAVPAVAGSPRSCPYDADGFGLAPVACIRDGKLAALAGPMKYARYLGIEPTGALPLFELAPGKLSVRELASKPHLEAVAFSDFFVDETTGDFGGELRLGYRVEGGERIPVSGGSITGNLAQNRGKILLSRELENTAAGRGPAACLVPLASIARVGE